MKKFILLSLILSAISNSKNFNYTLKSDADIIVNEKKIIYRPIDLKMSSKDNKYGFFLKIRGTYNKNENSIIYFEESEPLNTTEFNKEFIKSIKGKAQFENPINTNKNVHYHGTHEHDDSLEDHDHFFDNISHEHDPNVLTLDEYTFHKEKKYSPRFQMKLGAFYNPTKHSQIKISYMPLSYDSDERRYYNSIVFDGKYTHLFKDNLALIVRPRFSTEQLYKPSFTELKTDLRYKSDKDTTLSAYVYNGLQLKDMKYKTIFLNSLQLTYDYNTEKRKFHEFYEILDHEHEKIDQTKLSVRFAHEGRYLKSPTENPILKHEYKTDIYKTNVDFTYKKTIKKDFIIENKFKLDNEIQKINDAKRNYVLANETITNKQNEIKKIPKKSINKFKEIKSNSDLSELEIINTNKKENLFLKSIYKSIEKKEYDSRITKNETNVSNNTNIKYKNFELNNFISAKIIKDNDTTFLNNLKLSYKKKLGYGFSLIPYIEKNIGLSITKDLQIPTKIVEFSIGNDFNSDPLTTKVMRFLSTI